MLVRRPRFLSPGAGPHVYAKDGEGRMYRRLGWALVISLICVSQATCLKPVIEGDPAKDDDIFEVSLSPSANCGVCKALIQEMISFFAEEKGYRQELPIVTVLVEQSCGVDPTREDHEKLEKVRDGQPFMPGENQQSIITRNWDMIEVDGENGAKSYVVRRYDPGEKPLFKMDWTTKAMKRTCMRILDEREEDLVDVIYHYVGIKSKHSKDFFALSKEKQRTVALSAAQRYCKNWSICLGKDSLEEYVPPGATSREIDRTGVEAVKPPQSKPRPSQSKEAEKKPSKKAKVAHAAPPQDASQPTPTGSTGDKLDAILKQLGDIRAEQGRQAAEIEKLKKGRRRRKQNGEKKRGTSKPKPKEKRHSPKKEEL